MAITNFIPTIWSENLYTALDKKYVAVANCTREYEGDIKNMGSVVKICGVGNVNVANYTKDTDMTTPQTLSDTVKELCIDKAKYFNFQIDDVDRAQCTPKLMDAAMSVAANALANAADQAVFQLYRKSDNRFTHIYETAEGLVDYLLSIRERLYYSGAVDSSQVILEISPAVATCLLKAKMLTVSDNTGIVETGCIGSFFGCKVFVSNNICTDPITPDETHYCIMRTTRSVAFAEQLSEIEAYRPEKRFADAVKGLHLYGTDIIYPDEYFVAEITLLNVI